MYFQHRTKVKDIPLPNVCMQIKFSRGKNCHPQTSGINVFKSVVIINNHIINLYHSKDMKVEEHDFQGNGWVQEDQDTKNL